MDHYQIARLIEDVGATSSRTEKEELIGHIAKSDLGQFVLRYTYDPFITYGMKVGQTEPGGKFSIGFTQALIEPLLKRLANRELTGHAAEREVSEVMQSLDKDGARLLYLILSKDLKCGVAEATINAAMPGLVPVFCVMRAHPYEAKRVKVWPMKGEFKLDGQRNTFLCHNGQGGFFTRSGKLVPSLDFLVEPVIKVALAVLQTTENELLRRTLNPFAGSLGRNARDDLSFMLDGEAMMGLFADTGALRRKDANATGAEFHLYDILSYADFDAVGSVGEELEVRRPLLAEFVRIAKKTLMGAEAEILQIVPQVFINSDEEAQAFFERARSMTLAAYLARGDKEREAELLKLTIDKATGKPKVLEGAMLKNPKGLYDKKKSYGWMKMKAEETKDLRITGWFEGKEGTRLEGKFGGWLVDHEGVEVRVGGGYSDEEREEALKVALAATAGQEPTVERGVKKRYFTGGRLAEVEFHEVTPDNSLRHPRFVRYRDEGHRGHFCTETR